MADQRVEAYAHAVRYALDQAGIPAHTALLLVARGGAAVDPALVDQLAQGRAVRVVTDEAAELGPAEEGSAVPEGCVLVALRPVAETAAPYRIRLAVYTSMRAAVGGTYRVERVGAGWSVTAVEDFFDLRS